jgi:hypothetical protein
LLTHFNGFIKPGVPLSSVFNEKDQVGFRLILFCVLSFSNGIFCFQLFEAADIIQKLQLVAQELPSSKFSVAQKLIGQKYDEIERSLIDEFVIAQHKRDRTRMKHIAGILSHFKGYSQCIDAFIEQSQSVTLMNYLRYSLM